MRLLVTNTRLPQSYAIIRALRPLAEIIVATVRTTHRVGSGLACSAAYSRLVDRRYPEPPPEAGWHDGRIERDNTASEEAYLRAILDICERERIDTVFPSADAWVYVLSKNKKRFAERGILLPVPDFEIVRTLLDKYRTVERALEIGFPCPRTFLAESDADVADAVRALPPPWVVKPRFMTGSVGLAILDQPARLIEHAKRIRDRQGAPMIQEYVPGKEKRNFYLVLDQHGDLVSAVSPRIVRYSRRLFRGSTAACVSDAPPAFTAEAARLVKATGWWGGLTVQTKIDHRDGTPKLMEMNPRLGASLWYRTEFGINEPLMCLKIARGEAVERAPDVPRGVMLLRPVEDAAGFVFEILDLAIYRIRTGLFRCPPLDDANAPMTISELFGRYREEYWSDRPRQYSPHFRYGLRDPLPGFLYFCSQALKYATSTRAELGR